MPLSIHEWPSCAAMDCYEPYYADDTDGVHFQVCVDGCYVQAHVSRALLMMRCAVTVEPTACVAIYIANRSSIDAAVERRVLREGPETVVLRFAELAEAPWT